MFEVTGATNLAARRSFIELRTAAGRKRLKWVLRNRFILWRVEDRKRRRHRELKRRMKRGADTSRKWRLRLRGGLQAKERRAILTQRKKVLVTDRSRSRSARRGAERLGSQRERTPPQTRSISKQQTFRHRDERNN